MSILVTDLEPNSNSIAERAMKRLQTSTSIEKSEYMDARYLVSTSKICERMFSIAGHALTNRCRGTILVSFECEIFSYMKFKFWGIRDIISIVYDNAGDTMHNKDH